MKQPSSIAACKLMGNCGDNYNAQISIEVLALVQPQPIPVSTTDVSDLLSLPVPPSTPALAVPKTPNSIMSSAPGDLNILGQQVDDGPATNEAHSSTPAHDQVKDPLSEAFDMHGGP